MAGVGEIEIGRLRASDNGPHATLSDNHSPQQMLCGLGPHGITFKNCMCSAVPAFRAQALGLSALIGDVIQKLLSPSQSHVRKPRRVREVLEIWH